MTSDLLEQLEIYGGDFDAALAPVALDDVTTERIGPRPVRPLRPRRPSESVRGWAIAAGTAVIVLLLVGAIAWLAGSDSDAVQ